MKKIVHLSDLHFGKVATRRITPLLETIANIKPDIIVISGDITQRAREQEFKDAQEFLGHLPYPLFIIPGNHDIAPIFRPFERLFCPFLRYQKYISPILSPVYEDTEVALVGLNSVRKFLGSEGSLRMKEVRDAKSHLHKVSGTKVKIIVSHHPFDIPQEKKALTHWRDSIVGGAKKAVKLLAEENADIFLSGHLHFSHVGDTTLRYNIDEYRALIVQAGTTISTRAEKEPVSFNVLTIDRPHIVVESYFGNAHAPHFDLTATSRFVEHPHGWIRE